ncbi:MAG TPA: hypothetical protein VLC09_03880 [Polyangiaceae bacterium]|nr:hypothetical protein [Polyangiaceae bacterium]
MTWDPFKDPIDYFKLSGRKSPGLATVAGIAPPQKWDERNGYGLSGATIVFTGLGLAKFSCEIELTTSEEWADWVAFRALLAPPKIGRRPRALDIWHPYLEDEGIKSVQVESRTMPKPTDTGSKLITIDFIQYRRPKLALVKPDGSQSTPNDPYEQVINDLTGQVQELLDA